MHTVIFFAEAVTSIVAIPLNTRLFSDPSTPLPALVSRQFQQCFSPFV